MKFSCNISLKFSRRQNFMKSYITNCDRPTDNVIRSVTMVLIYTNTNVVLRCGVIILHIFILRS